MNRKKNESPKMESFRPAFPAIIIGLLFAVIFTLLAFISFVFGANDSLGVFLGLASSVIASLLVAAIFRSLSADEVSVTLHQVEKVASGMKEDFAVMQTGLHKLVMNPGTSDYQEKFKNADSIDIYCNTGISTIRSTSESLIEAINNGCEVRVMMNDMDNPFFTDEENKKAYCPNNSIEIDSVNIHKILLKISEASDTGKGGFIKAKKANCLLMGNLIIINKKICYYTPYFPHQLPEDTLRFTFRDNGGKYFEKFTKNFEKIWTAKETVFIDSSGSESHEVKNEEVILRAR